MRQKLFGLFLLALLLCTPQLFKQVTGGFRIQKTLIAQPADPRWTVRSLSSQEMEEVSQVLSKPFTYLSRGSQAFVFVSEDGRYVLKLFRSALASPPWREWFRTHLRGRPPKSSVQERIHRVLSATKLAFEEASDWTGLVYVHLNSTQAALPQATLFDCLGRVFRPDLDQTRFVLQRRATPIREALFSAIQRKDEGRIRTLLHSFADLIGARASKKIRNRDLSVYRNFGCLGDQVIEWDFGNYQMDHRLNKEEELRRFAPPLRAFLAMHAPEWLNEYDEKMALRSAPFGSAQYFSSL